MFGPETHIATNPNYDPHTDGRDGAHPLVYDGIAYAGLTKREYFAAKALQGLLANPNVEGQKPALSQATIAERAVGCADALIDALNEGGDS